jgi:hypothetical protein
MKKTIITLFLFFMGFKGYAQETQTQTQKENIMTSQSAEFPGGDSAFANEFLQMVHAYIDLQKYAVNGKFVFVFDVNPDGKIR